MRTRLTLIAAAIAALALGTNAQAVDTKQIDQQHKAELAKCKDLKGNAKDVCKKEADGHKKVAKAEAELKEQDTPKNRLKVEEAKADAQYDVAKEKCDDQKGDAKSACKKAAKAEHEGAIAQARKASMNEEPKTKEAKTKEAKTKK
jgi:chromosome segregation ATPase